MLKLKLFLFFICFFTTSLLMAQAPDSLSKHQSLQKQYEFMLSKSRSESFYKLINPNRLSQLWKNVRDTIKIRDKEIIELNSNLKSYRDKEAEALKQAEALKNELKTKIGEDEIVVLGMVMKKESFKTIFWVVLISLLLVIAFIATRIAKFRIDAQQAQSSKSDLESELQDYKQKSKQREMKLARELQDERNKLEEFRGR